MRVCAAGFLACGFLLGCLLPGDGFEQAEADDETKDDDKEDGPCVGGQLEGWAGAGGSHGEVSFGEGAMRTKKRAAATAMKF
jgi:hypothetical protein